MKYFDFKRYFKLISKASNLIEKGFSDSNSFFKDNSDIFLKVFLDSEIRPEAYLDLLEQLIKGRNKLNSYNLNLFLPSLRHLLLVNIFQLLNNTKESLLDTLLNNNCIIYLELLLTTFDKGIDLKELRQCFYPRPDNFINQKEQTTIKELLSNIEVFILTKNQAFENTISSSIEKINLSDSIQKESFSKLIEYLLNFYEYRIKTNEVYETFCVLAEEHNSSILIASLEIIKSNTQTNSSYDDIEDSNILIASLENVPNIKNTNSEKKLKENIKKALNFIYENKPELKEQLLSNKYLFTLRSTRLIESNSIIEGDSLSLSLLMLIFSSKMYLNPISLDSGVCLTGELTYNFLEWEVSPISSVKDKAFAIKKYNETQLFGAIKVLFVPEKNKTLFSSAIESENIEEVDSYEKVTHTNQLYLKGIKNLLDIDFIDPFMEYLKYESQYFKDLLKDNLFNELFETKYEAIDYFIDYFSKLSDDKITENDRYELLIENNESFFDKEGLIITCFIEDIPKDFAKFFSSFISFNREKLNFRKIPVPIMINIRSILDINFELESFLIEKLTKHNIKLNTIQKMLKNEYSFIFILYDENHENSENIFYGKELISQLIHKNFLLCCANSIEQAKFWASK